MKKLRKVLSVAMALVLLVTGIQVSGLTVNAETEWTETAITSLKYEVTVENSVSGGDALKSFDWKTTDGNWADKTTTVALSGDGNYTIEVTSDSASGMVNLGYIAQIEDSAMTVTMNKVIVNGYELVYETAPVLKANSSWENGLASIWSGLESGTKICGSDNAYLVFDGTAQLIKFYVGPENDDNEGNDGDSQGTQTEWVETAVSSVKYEVTVAGADVESFDWKTTDGNWSDKITTVALNGDGNYTIEIASDSASGMINLGYIIQIEDSAMTVTVNKVVVNGYELVYETAPVLKAGSSWENGLANIWSGLESGTKICGSDNAYLVFDGAAELIKFYVGPENDDNEGNDGDSQGTQTEWVETAVSSVKYEVTVSGADVESFDWKTTDGNWSDKITTVALNGDGNYTIEVASDSASGMVNLGYIIQIEGSAMTVTMNKVIVNGYELVYETAPVLKAGSSWENGLVNIWSGLESGAKVCGSDDAYLVFDGDASLIKFYIKQATGSDDNDDIVITDTASLNYVKAMGDGWNLGNSFDGVNTSLEEEDLGETAWGNPVVTKELIQAVAAKGYDSIRIPITFSRRFDEETYELDEAWLARCKEVIQWALDENLYVMINVHHDSWIWLKYWDGNVESEEYVKFKAIWEQYAEYFKDLPQQVCFETINEPTFEATGDITAQKKLDMVNQAAYDAIRNSGGNNETRMIVIPTMTTNHGDEHCEATVEFMEAQEDENLIATVHYYSEWVHSAGIGKTGFDEVLWQNNGVDYTPRDSVDLFYDTLQKQFLNKGIGVIVGEWGLLGYDSASQVNQAGEELKYYEYMNYYANATDVCLMFWDNGSGISRTSGDYSWKKPLVGEMLEISMSERSAYVKDLDRVFFAEETTEDVSFALTLNGLTFAGMEGLVEGTDYTYDEANTTVTLSKDYVNGKYTAMGAEYGTFAELVFQFSGGADWYEYLIKYAAPVMEETTGTVSDIKIPVEFNGSEVRRATAYMASGKVGPNSSWWDYLQYGGAFLPDYEDGTIAILSGFWDDDTVKNVDGAITFHFEMYDGAVVKYTLEKDGENVTGYPVNDASEATFDWAKEMCVYVGETEFPAEYFDIPEGTSIFGTYPWDAPEHITLEGWPATCKFGTVAQEESIQIGLLLTYMDYEIYADGITFWLKDAPEVEAVTVEEGEDASVVVKNLVEGAQITYEVADTTIATVSEDGSVSGEKAGTTAIIVTVTQYGRTDSFEAEVTVEAVEAPQTSEEPETTQAPQTSEEPETTQAPQTSEAPETTQAPQTSEEPETTQAPQTSEEPETTQAPQTSEAPETTQAPQPTQAPENAYNGQLANPQSILERIQDMLTDAEREAIENGAAVNAILRVVDTMNTIAQEVRDAFAEAIGGETIGTFLDITLGVQIGNGAERDVHETSGDVSISVVIPESLRNNNPNVNRTYHVWRRHNDVIERMVSAYDATTHTLVFDTDGFSDYAITYTDTAVNNNSGNNNNSSSATPAPADTVLDTVPKTGDTYGVFLWFALMVVAGLGAVVYGCKKTKETSKE